MKSRHAQIVVRLALVTGTLLGGDPRAALASTGGGTRVPVIASGADGVGGIEKQRGAHGPAGTPQPAGSATGATVPQPAPEPWIDLGQGLEGATGWPALSGDGSGAPGTPITLSLSDAVCGGSATLVIGLAAAPVPFKGGTLVPQPDLVLTGLPVGSNGTLVLPAILPAGLPSGLQLCLQAWMADPGAPSGFAASNGLLLTIP